MIFIIILLSVGLITSIYANINMIKKQEYFEEFFESLHAELQFVFNRIKEIDEKGAFQADDEVGDMYDSIRTTIIRLKIFLGDDISG